MLKENFFTIDNFKINGFEIGGTFLIDESHTIFNGHFPGQPVVPGVCMLQMIKEMLQMVIDKKLVLVKASEMKFLAIIDPLKNKFVHGAIQYSIGTDEHISVTAKIFSGELIHFKFKGVFGLSNHLKYPEIYL